MKKYLLTISILISLATFCFGQTDSLAANKKCCNRWELGLAYNSVEAQMSQALLDSWVFPSANYYGYFGNKTNRSFSFSLMPKYRISDDLFVRFEFGITKINLYSHFNGINDSLAWSQGIGASVDMIKDDTIQQSIYKVATGIQWNFIKKKKIESFCGASLFYLHYSAMHWSDYISDNQVPGRATDYIASTQGGFESGFEAYSGINIYANKRISFGAEISYSLSYFNIGGIQNGLQVSIFPNSPTQLYNWSIEDNISKGIHFSKVMPSFNIGFRL